MCCWIFENNRLYLFSFTTYMEDSNAKAFVHAVDPNYISLGRAWHEKLAESCRKIADGSRNKEQRNLVQKKVEYVWVCVISKRERPKSETSNPSKSLLMRNQSEAVGDCAGQQLL